MSPIDRIELQSSSDGRAGHLPEHGTLWTHEVRQGGERGRERP